MRGLFLLLALVLLLASMPLLSSAATISACGAVSAGENELDANISDPGNCLTISDSHTVLDCMGYTITYNTGGGAGSAGIDVGNSIENVTIKNCVIVDNNDAGSSGNGIEMDFVDNALIFNNTIITNGTTFSIPIALDSCDNVSIDNNNLTAVGSGNSNYGVYIEDLSVDNNVTNNIISTSGGSDNYGVHTRDDSEQVLIENNSITTSGSFDRNYGVYLFDSRGDRVINNTIDTTGGRSLNYGILLHTVTDSVNVSRNKITTGSTSSNFGISVVGSGSQSNGTIEYNVINTTGTSTNNYGVSISNVEETYSVSHNNITTNGSSGANGLLISGTSTQFSIENNIVTVNTDSAHALVSPLTDSNITGNTFEVNGDDRVIAISTASDGNVFASNNFTSSQDTDYVLELVGSTDEFHNNIITAQTDDTDWIIQSSSGVDNNFTNTTFATPYGSINLTDFFNYTGSGTLTRDELNISFNNSFLDLSVEPGLNLSARIILKYLNFTNATAVVDINDNGTYLNCSSPQCSFVSYTKTADSNGIFIFDVQHFTSYAAGDGPVAPKISVNVTSPTEGFETESTDLDVEYVVNTTNISQVNCSYSDNGAANVSLTGCANITSASWDVGTHNVTLYVNDSAGAFNFTSIFFTILASSVTTSTDNVGGGGGEGWDERYTSTQGIYEAQFGKKPVNEKQEIINNQDTRDSKINQEKEKNVEEKDNLGRDNVSKSEIEEKERINNSNEEVKRNLRIQNIILLAIALIALTIFLLFLIRKRKSKKN